MPKLLIVDDEEDDIALTKMTIRKRYPQATILSSRSGPEAIRKCLTFPFDIVFMDINMQGMNGMQAILELRRIGYEKLLYSLSDTLCHNDIQNCGKNGSNGHIPKSENEANIFAAINEIIE